MLITVDNIIEEHTVDELSVIKIDTDGFEMGVLLGAKRTIENYRPSIVFEYGPDYLRNHSVVEPQELINFLKGFGYEIFYENFEPFDPRGLRLGVDETINLVALHKDKPLTPIG